MENFEPNDFVYVKDIGFCQLVSCGKHRNLKIKRKEQDGQGLPQLDGMTQKKPSMYFPGDSFFFQQEGMVVPQAEPQPTAPKPQQKKQVKQESAPAEVKQQKPVVVAQQQPNIVSAKLWKTNILVYTPDTNITKTINLKVKTFFGNRRQFQIKSSISSSIQQLKNSIIQATKQTPANIDNPRLISSSTGILVEYGNPKEFIYSTKLKNDSKLILLANIRFSLDPTLKGPNMNLSNNNRTVTRQHNDGGFELILGNTTLYGGKHYFQTKIDKMVDDQDIIVGVCSPSVKLTTNNLAEQPVWGYQCLAAKKVGKEPEGQFTKDYGPYCKVNDIVGTLIQIDSHSKVTLSYYVNSKFVGKAFEGVIQAPICPVVCFNATANAQVSINTSVQIPFDIANFSGKP